MQHHLFNSPGSRLAIEDNIPEDGLLDTESVVASNSSPLLSGMLGDDNFGGLTWL